MEAKNSRSGSYAWTSILKGPDVIQRGVLLVHWEWKICEGWHHHWLPIKYPPMVSSPIMDSLEELTVEELIDTEPRR